MEIGYAVVFGDLVGASVSDIRNLMVSSYPKKMKFNNATSARNAIISLSGNVAKLRNNINYLIDNYNVVLNDSTDGTKNYTGAVAYTIDKKMQDLISALMIDYNNCVLILNQLISFYNTAVDRSNGLYYATATSSSVVKSITDAADVTSKVADEASASEDDTGAWN